FPSYGVYGKARPASALKRICGGDVQIVQIAGAGCVGADLSPTNPLAESPKPNPPLMRFAAFCLAPLVLATLSACAAHPRAADVRLPGGYEAPAGAPPGAIALDTWWTAFDDAELTSLVEQALARNPDVRTA